MSDSNRKFSQDPYSLTDENKEIEISKLVKSKNLFEKARKYEKLFTSETKSLKKIMRSLTMSTIKKLQCTKVESNYEKRIVCLSLSGDETVRFSSTLRNRKNDTVTYDDYVISFKVLQRESLSPLLFVLCMDPLSQIPRKKYTKETIQTDAESQTNNPIFLLSDLKLFGFDKIFEGDWLGNQQREDSTNALYCEDTCHQIPLKNTRGNPIPGSFDELDDAVRAKLVKTKLLLRLRCKERLYISIKEREVAYLVYVANLKYASATFRCSKNELRKYKLHEQQSSRLFKSKVQVGEEVKRKSLEEAQLTKLYNKIEKLKLHSKLYNARRNELVGVSDSSRWPKKGNIGPRNEAMFYYCHDRNLIREADERACRDKSEHQNKNDVKIRCNRSQIFISEKIKKMIPLIEVEIEMKKLRKYDLLAAVLVRNDEDSVNHLKKKNNTLYMLEGGTKFVEPTINLNEESDLEEKTGVKDIGENI
ncbi:hypothetical protein CWI38_0192p0020 [Hamiltosporidium tvaerminnensis]|uniref:Uncharacterized protein n=1 Tax=Hamiltosporidium tvaerminnensis TaxID=1176355 RepID=A0A4Q9M1I5_9MICR|nr:hypothetical protein CWI38_0282p0020 [Hamiltosporidium tvaerminnensis]TBU19828.1 hypothetical protein CWI38_0192p0020 [Hamiltosporidium tvaerminnensis]